MSKWGLKQYKWCTYTGFGLTALTYTTFNQTPLFQPFSLLSLLCILSGISGIYKILYTPYGNPLNFLKIEYNELVILNQTPIPLEQIKALIIHQGQLTIHTQLQLNPLTLYFDPFFDKSLVALFKQACPRLLKDDF